MVISQIAENALRFFVKYCEDKKYQLNKIPMNEEDVKLEISNNHERTIVSIYHTGKIVMGGQKNNLKKEFEALKEKFEQATEVSSVEEKVKACTVTYDIMLNKLRADIKSSLSISGATSEAIGSSTSAIEWRSKFNRNRKSVTLTQFNNGTLSIQGRQDDLLDEICDAVEKIVNPSEKEIVARFVSGDDNALKKCTPEILDLAERNIRGKLGKAFDFLESHDQKWVVAAECLSLARIPLPEFSPVVMPASKAFEGFAKKLLVAIGLFDPGYFNTEKANFALVNDEKSQDPKRLSVCARDKNVNILLKNLYSRIQIHRHFMMHSDSSLVTKIDTHEEAVQKVIDILRDIESNFTSFNKIFNFA